MLTSLLTLALFIGIYLISDKLSNYTLLSRYTWFDNLSMKLFEYEGRFKWLLQKIYYSKLFTCRSCNVFWISIAITLTFFYSFSEATELRNVITSTRPQDLIIFSLITFLIHKVENDDVQ